MGSCRWGQFLQLCAIVVTAHAAAVDAHQRAKSNHQLALFQYGRRRVHSQDAEGLHFVEMPPQHRLLPAQKSFLAVCAMIKV